MPRLLFFQGSARNPRGEAHQRGKTAALMRHAVAEAERLGAEVDIIDLSVAEESIRVQPCYACISTAGGYHCHYPCDCYLRPDEMEGEEAEEEEEMPSDFLAENRVFDRVMAADAFLVYTPINWYAVPTQVKAMFDRFVCANLTLTRADAADLLGEENLKNPTVTRAAEKAGVSPELLTNHWAGKYAAFFVHGDDGADDYLDRPKPRSLRLYPDETAAIHDPKMAVMPLVQQMRYSGVNVPEDLIVRMHINRGIDYATANDVTKHKQPVFDKAAELVRRTLAAVRGGVR